MPLCSRHALASRHETLVRHLSRGNLHSCRRRIQPSSRSIQYKGQVLHCCLGVCSRVPLVQCQQALEEKCRISTPRLPTKIPLIATHTHASKQACHILAITSIGSIIALHPNRKQQGKTPRAQSSKTHKASTLTRMAQQHHHDSLSQHTSQYSYWFNTFRDCFAE